MYVCMYGEISRAERKREKQKYHYLSKVMTNKITLRPLRIYHRYVQTVCSLQKYFKSVVVFNLRLLLSGCNGTKGLPRKSFRVDVAKFKASIKEICS